MQSQGYKIRDDGGVYFITFATVEWVDVFSRRMNADPILLETQAFTLEKLNYIHQNPVKAGIVDKAEEYLLRSARDYNGPKV